LFIKKKNEQKGNHNNKLKETMTQTQSRWRARDRGRQVLLFVVVCYLAEEESVAFGGRDAPVLMLKLSRLAFGAPLVQSQ
jgi:hypothetical protein